MSKNQLYVRKITLGPFDQIHEYPYHLDHSRDD